MWRPSSVPWWQSKPATGQRRTGCTQQGWSSYYLWWTLRPTKRAAPRSRPECPRVRILRHPHYLFPSRFPCTHDGTHNPISHARSLSRFARPCVFALSLRPSRLLAHPSLSFAALLLRVRSLASPVPIACSPVPFLCCGAPPMISCPRRPHHAPPQPLVRPGQGRGDETPV